MLFFVRRCLPLSPEGFRASKALEGLALALPQASNDFLGNFQKLPSGYEVELINIGPALSLALSAIC